jgi:hypothetical protein
MKVWKVNTLVVNDDVALESELNRLERVGAKIKEIILIARVEAQKLDIYKIIYTVEDIAEG